MQQTVYVGLGSNLGNRAQTLRWALESVGHIKQTRLCHVSRFYETAPVGGPRQPAYLNAVAKCKTSLSPQSFFRELTSVEKQGGRARRIKWGPRTLDLDILAVGQILLNTKKLKIPHPRYHQRRFVLVPFCDVAPGFIHPRLKKRNQTLLHQLTSPGQRVTIWTRWKKYQSLVSTKRKKTKSPSQR